MITLSAAQAALLREASTALGLGQAALATALLGSVLDRAVAQRAAIKQADEIKLGVGVGIGVRKPRPKPQRGGRR